MSLNDIGLIFIFTILAFLIFYALREIYLIYKQLKEMDTKPDKMIGVKWKGYVHIPSGEIRMLPARIEVSYARHVLNLHRVKGLDFTIEKEIS